MLHYRLHSDPRSSHQQIAQFLRQVQPALTLDVGAAQGFIGQILQGSGLTIDAIEPQAQWAQHAKPFYRNVYPCTVEQANLPDRTYDAIVCGDVLEHLVDPVAVLKQLRRIAKDDATFIISVPNVAHLAIRLMLLAGRFPKMDRGILDRTHLHFFTRDTAQDLLRSAGLKMEQVVATGVPLDEVWRTGQGKLLFRAMRSTQQAAVSLLPRVFGFQWIFLARPEANPA